MTDSKPLNNLKTAMNDLMGGKVATDDENSASSLLDELPKVSSPTTSIDNNTPSNYSESVLSSDITIEGNIKSTSNMRINGHVKGDVSCEGDLASAGTIEGVIKAVNISLTKSSVNGDIIARGNLKVDEDSVVLGDVSAIDMAINGRVRGNISAAGNVILREKAVILGNVIAKGFSVESGASIKGSLEIKNPSAASAIASFDKASSTPKHNG